MEPRLEAVLALLAAAIVMFAINRPRMDAVALIMLTALPFTGAVTMGEALAGFSDPNIVLIAALFVIGDGLVRTGVARRLGDWLIGAAGASEARLVVLLMLVVCGLGSMMSSTAVTAIFIPVALRISQSTGTSPGRLMMPLSVAALVSGMMTLIATAPNLVVNSELTRAGFAGFGFFSFTPFGVPVLAAAVVYMLFARRLLPAADPAAPGTTPDPGLADWVKLYQLAGREHLVRVAPGSPLDGHPLGAARLRSAAGANVVAVDRHGRLHQPHAGTVVHAGDVLLIDLFDRAADPAALREQLGLIDLPLGGAFFTDRSQEIGMAELIVPADSDLVGKTVAEARFRDRTGLTAIGLRRGAEAVPGGPHGERLKVGDTLLAIGKWKRFERLRPSAAGVLVMRLPAEAREVLPVTGRLWHAVACLAVTVGLMVGGVVPNVQAALIGCLLMGLLKCVDLTSAYRSVDWKTIVLIVGMLPFSLALQRTGGVDLAADALRSATSGAGTHAVLACLFAITALLGMFISNTATAVLMAPVAIAVAKDLGASPHPFAMTVALAASTAFMTPVSSPVNTLVVTPGNYTFGDFIKVGVPFSLVVLVLTVVLVPLLLPP